MTSKSFDTALDFLPETKVGKRGPRLFSMFNTLIEAFEEARAAESQYRELVAHGMPHEQAARKVFERTYTN